MPYEHMSLATERKRSPEKRGAVFDMEQMRPDQIAGLVAALGMAYDARDAAHQEEDDPQLSSLNELIDLVKKDLENTARTSDKAMEIYATLMNHPSSWPQELAAYGMAAALLHRNLDNPEALQHVIDPWVNLLRHEKSEVREGVEYSIAKVIGADWLDESTARYLGSQLPAD